jgi:PhnB protein
MKKKTIIKDGPPSGLTPILSVDDANKAASFYKSAFHATEVARIASPDGKRLMHVRMLVFGSVFVFMDEFPELSGKNSGLKSPYSLGGTSVTLHLQVDDAQAVWKQALEAGASTVIPLEKQFWGELYGRLKDPFGHEWTVAQMLHHLDNDQVEKAAITLFNK